MEPLEGQADKVLGKTVLGRRTGARQFGMSQACCEPESTGHHLGLYRGGEGILGNDFAMAHPLTVRPHEAAIYLPTTFGGGREDMGERLPWAVRSIAEVRVINNEAFAVRAVERSTLAPRTVSQVSVIVSVPIAKGTVMVEARPGPLGLCPI